MSPLGRPVFHPGSVRRVVAGLFSLFYLWQTRASERVHLSSLDARALRDIGLSAADVEREARKPFWQA
ncbi:hypothetical protein OCH7691_03582 [Oceanibacterium hippocampi]|uniref:YjiS-like domain-containing protein n=1 Tax=Oceanibacterium hippocampi TaxID=745714 RepID=A0A1Y5TVP8_9PROT|nr:hypothetical protein OCH7691_03582 [Oceanibacterium hippocampi]